MFGTPTTYNQESLKGDKLKLKMRTKSTVGKNVKLESCTEFSLHIRQKNISSKKYPIDYSERKLEKYIDTIKDPQQKMVLIALLHDYLKGDVAVAWRRGHPVYIQVVKE